MPRAAVWQDTSKARGRGTLPVGRGLWSAVPRGASRLALRQRCRRQRYRLGPRHRPASVSPVHTPLGVWRRTRASDRCRCCAVYRTRHTRCMGRSGGLGAGQAAWVWGWAVVAAGWPLPRERASPAAPEAARLAIGVALYRNRGRRGRRTSVPSMEQEVGGHPRRHRCHRLRISCRALFRDRPRLDAEAPLPPIRSQVFADTACSWTSLSESCVVPRCSNVGVCSSPPFDITKTADNI